MKKTVTTKIYALFKVLITSLVCLFALASCGSTSNNSIKNDEVNLAAFYISDGAVKKTDLKQGLVGVDHQVKIHISLDNPKSYSIKTVTFGFEGEGAVTYNTTTYKFFKHNTEGESEGTIITWNSIDKGSYFIFTSKTDADITLTFGDTDDVTFSHIKVYIKSITYGNSSVVAAAHIGDNNAVDLYRVDYPVLLEDQIVDNGENRTFGFELAENISDFKVYELSSDKIKVEIQPVDGLYTSAEKIVYVSYKVTVSDDLSFEVPNDARVSQYEVWKDTKKN